MPFPMRQPISDDVRLGVFDLLPKREKGEFHQFKALKPQGYADDGDAEYDARHEITETEPEAAQNKPDDIDDRRRSAAAVDDLLTERNERKMGKLKALQTDGNADDGAAQNDPDDEPGEGRFPTDDDDPNDVSEQLHKNTSR